MIKVQITISQGMTNGFQMKKTHTVTLYGHDFKTQTVNRMKKKGEVQDFKIGLGFNQKSSCDDVILN